MKKDTQPKTIVEKIAKACSRFIIVLSFIILFLIAYLFGMLFTDIVKAAPRLTLATGSGFAFVENRQDDLKFGTYLNSGLVNFTKKEQDKRIIRLSGQFASKQGHEGFTSCPIHDLGGGYSIGYGTISYKNEPCISKKEAARRRDNVMTDAYYIIPEDLRISLPENELVALTDVIYNVRPQNYNYIIYQFRITDKVKRKKEITYALSTMACARATPAAPCIRHGGLITRYRARLDLIFK